MTTYDRLLAVLEERRAGFWVLLDPDAESPERLAQRAWEYQEGGADAILIGGSLIVQDGFQEAVEAVKAKLKIPLLLFPGGPGQLSRHADAVLFLSLISGRNPQFLIGDHVTAAPTLKRLKLEAIPTGYLLISSGTATSVEFISHTQPLPRDKVDLAAAHALAGQLLGMKLIYLEGGSGARESVPGKLISRVREWVELPIIVGGGIRTPDEAASKIMAGADFIVIGTALEADSGCSAEDFSIAIHAAGGRKMLGR